jgi:hypothetical protein
MTTAAIAPTLNEIMRRLLAPERPRLTECVAIVEGCASGDEAWDRLCARAVIDAAFATTASRTFAAPVRTGPSRWHSRARCPDALCPYCSTSAWLSASLQTPATALAAATVASDPVGITTAEALACECAMRLGLEQPRTFHWMVADRSVLVRTAPSLMAFSASGALTRAHSNEGVPDARTLTVHELGIFSGALDDWLVAVVVGALSTSASNSALAPFSALWRSGYALLALEGDVAILGAPLVRSEVSIVKDLPAEAQLLRRSVFLDSTVTHLIVDAFETAPKTHEGLLDLRTRVIDKRFAATSRWEQHDVPQWIQQLVQHNRSLGPSAAASAVERIGQSPFAVMRSYDLATALWSGNGARQEGEAIAIITDDRIFVITSWAESNMNWY